MNNLAAIARGDYPADLVIKNARVANVFTCEYEHADVAVYRGVIAGVGAGYDGKMTYDAEGRVLIPSLIDGHTHIEDTMLTPANFAEIAALDGTGTVYADPHEIANAMGLRGVEYMYRASQGLSVDIYYGAPSCVPASDFETPYQELDMNALRDLMRRQIVSHLGEMMNFPAVIAGDPDAWGKILTAGDVPLTGHAPSVAGKLLNAYLASGVNSDHECTTLTEAREKLSRGVWLMLREGSSFHDLTNLLPLVQENPLFAARCMAVSDDLTATDLVRNGHMTPKLRTMINAGLDPFTALRMVTLTPAEYFRAHDRGAISPARIADFALLDADTLSPTFRISEVWKRGRLVIKNGELWGEEPHDYAVPLKPSHLANVPAPENLRVRAQDGLLRVIGINDGSAVTSELLMTPRILNGYAVADPARDIAKVVCLERHHDTGRFGVGFVRGLSLRDGAIASSVAHDAHNFVAVGADDVSISTALHKLSDMGGGLCVVKGREIIGEFALPVGGLMSVLPAHEVAQSLGSLEAAAQTLGVTSPHPFMVMSFLCLSVIPELRITDAGLMSVSQWRTVPLFTENVR